MFLGQFQHTLDAKGRVILPAAYREELEEGLVMTIAQDNCVAVHPVAAWQELVADLSKLRTTDRDERAYARMLTSSAYPETLDKQGRITVPPLLREYAGLTKDVAVVGNISRVELWDADAWQRYRSTAMVAFANTSRPFEQGAF